MATKSEQIDFVRRLYPAAKVLEDNGGVSALFVMAQAALETGWKIRGIGNNIFGITKGGSWKGKCELRNTREVFKRPDVVFKEPEKVLSVNKRSDGRYDYRVMRLFRVYDSLADCLNDHLSVLRLPHFSHAWEYRKDAKEFVRLLQSGIKKYATDPNYVGVMCSVIDGVDRIIKDEGL